MGFRFSRFELSGLTVHPEPFYREPMARHRLGVTISPPDRLSTPHHIDLLQRSQIFHDELELYRSVNS